jgi:serine/threonine protein kinase
MRYTKTANVSKTDRGFVWRCKNENGVRLIAKSLSVSPESVNESTIAAVLKHPHIVDLLDCFRTEDNIVLIFEQLSLNYFNTRTESLAAFYQLLQVSHNFFPYDY